MLLKNISKTTFDYEGKVVPPEGTMIIDKIDRGLQTLINRRYFEVITEEVEEAKKEEKRIKVEVVVQKSIDDEFEEKVIPAEFGLTSEPKSKQEESSKKKHNKNLK